MSWTAKIIGFILLMTVVLPFYIGAALPGDHYMAVMRSEFQDREHVWDTKTLTSVLQRARTIHSFIPGIEQATQPVSQGEIENIRKSKSVVEQKMAAVIERTQKTGLWAGVSNSLRIAAFRISQFVEWAIYLSAFLIALWLDSLIQRHIRKQELRVPRPEFHGIWFKTTVFGLFLSILALLSPWATPFWLWPLSVAATLGAPALAVRMYA